MVTLGSLFVFSPVNAASLDDGLVAFYCFDDAKDIGKDCSSNGNNGSLEGQVKSVTGLNGKAASFGGLNNPADIHVPNSESLQFADDATFSFFVKMNGFDGMDGYGSYSASGVHGVIAKSHDRTGIAFMAYGDVATNSFGVGNAAFEWAEENRLSGNISNYKANTWNHVVYTFSNKTHTSKLFINGALIKSIDNFNQDLSSLNSQDLYLGKYSDSWYPLNGSLDDVKIYNRALSDTEVSSLYGGISGNVKGLQKYSAVCKNLKTNATKKIALADGAKEWNCKAAGLQSKKGENVSVTITGDSQ